MDTGIMDFEEMDFEDMCIPLAQRDVGRTERWMWVGLHEDHTAGAARVIRGNAAYGDRVRRYETRPFSK